MAADMGFEIPWLQWYEDPNELARLWRWLVDNNEAPEDPAAFMENPTSWEADFVEMCEQIGG